MRKEFEMTNEQLEKLLDACQPVPYIVAGGIEPLSPQENANRAWEALGEEMGFEYMSVEPIEDKDLNFFTAEVTEK